MLYQSSLTSKGQVTIPQAIRKFLGLQPHDRISFITKKDTVQLVPVVDIKSLKGSLKSNLKRPPTNEEMDKAVL